MDRKNYDSTVSELISRGEKYKVGDIVEVFDDPISKLLSQGQAKIVSSILPAKGFYKVIFLNDEKAKVVGRFIF